MKQVQLAFDIGRILAGQVHAIQDCCSLPLAPWQAMQVADSAAPPSTEPSDQKSAPPTG